MDNERYNVENEEMVEPVGRDDELDTRDSLLKQNRKKFILLFAVVALFIVMFILYSAGVIPLLVVDCVLIPVALAAVLVFLQAKKR